MKKDLGLLLSEIFKKQRTTFIRTADGKKIITNRILYNSYEEEALRIQEKMGRENKKIIIAECKRRSIPIPNFRKEGIAKI